MKAFSIASGITVFSLLLPLGSSAAQNDELLSLINDYRADPPACEGRQRDPVTPLAPEPALVDLNMDGGRQLNEALRSADFKAARVELLQLSGPTDASAAMRFAAQRNCRALLNPNYTVAGVSRDGSDWQIVLARPQLDPSLGDWQEAGQQVLKLTNDARAEGRRCGNQRFEAASALAWNEMLGATALAHSKDMAERSTLSHAGGDGSTVGARAKQQGYAWQSIGENVATGQGSPQQVVNGWLSSPGHCANLMNPAFSEMGAAYATNPESDTTIYWTQVFAAPR